MTDLARKCFVTLAVAAAFVAAQVPWVFSVAVVFAVRVEVGL